VQIITGKAVLLKCTSASMKRFTGADGVYQMGRHEETKILLMRRKFKLGKLRSGRRAFFQVP
jgi:hypothetical protein